MNITEINNNYLTGNIKSVKSSEIKENFLKLLVAQLKNQDPINPLDNQQLTSQLAILSQVESLENIKNSQFDMINVSVSSLLGAKVRGVKESGVEIFGVVNSIRMTDKGPLLETANGELELKEIIEIFK